MVGSSGEFRPTPPALIASVPITIVYFAVLGIILTAAGPTVSPSRTPRRADGSRCSTAYRRSSLSL